MNNFNDSTVTLCLVLLGLITFYYFLRFVNPVLRGFRDCWKWARAKWLEWHKAKERRAQNLKRLQNVKPMSVNVCNLCGSPITQKVCLPCEKMKLTHIDGIRMAIAFERDAETLIKRLKKAHDSLIFDGLMDYTCQAVNVANWQIDQVAYVPKLEADTYNLSQDMAKAMAARLAMPMLKITKTRETHKQKAMRRVIDRHANLYRAFAFEGDLSGKNVLILDDFSTSGATFDTLAELLKKRGAVMVYGLALARRTWQGQ